VSFLLFGETGAPVKTHGPDLNIDRR